MNDLTFWITYHEDSQIEQYGLYEDETHKLFKGNNLDIEGENINHLNPFYSELVTLYWVWKNQIKSKMVGFCHYRRRFRETKPLRRGQCQVLAINRNCHVFGHYKACHNYQDYYDAIDILNEQYGNGNKYVKYLLESRTFIPYCCFIMHWEDFDALCQFLYPILNAYDKKNGLNHDPKRYAEKAQKDFRYGNVLYQRRAASFLAERLISCYLVCEMKCYCIYEM